MNWPYTASEDDAGFTDFTEVLDRMMWSKVGAPPDIIEAML